MASQQDIDEYNALTLVLSSLYNYSGYAKRKYIDPRIQKWNSLSKDDQELLPFYQRHLDSLNHCISMNENFTKDVALNSSSTWGVTNNPNNWNNNSVTSTEFDKITKILNQYVREWSEAGSIERDQSFGLILKECELLFPEFDKRSDVKVLVPGAGLGRLVVEFVKRGFQCQGNEFSYFMLLNSNYILNNTYMENNFIICPYIHKFSNINKKNDQLRQVFIPDYNPNELSKEFQENHPNIDFENLMSMVAGSFVDLYGPNDLNSLTNIYTNNEEAVNFRKENFENWDIISTCFFLDTASNIIDYLRTIKHALKKNGKWINFGPLLWHHEDDETVDNFQRKKNGSDSETESVLTPLKGLELTREDLITLIESMGFKFIKHESGIETTYGGDDKSLGSWKYKCEFWVCEKVE
ncbi:unnamed protein product [[Candida] boidinii]|uniref:carnosine N-methyltransferase n=1 Tax=Candida boidinii TaxID=5477 RepID=A0A9W6SVZ7_CANBO|nr:hypothetical protein B5S30_g153 [[Candida] boidinii]GME67939.1 unnamed protein product [[Candida] boidinii]GMF50509.1 unnamed protein product [[Candida] boidinii]GMG00256.1 unnamed protein product [[Candida] boidinii]